MSTPSKLNAEHYQAHSGKQQNLAEKLVRMHSFKSTEHILDIGCGNGSLTAKMSTRVQQGKVHGIDPSNEMIDYAKKHFPPEKFNNLSFAIGTAEENHGDACYSLVTAFSCLHWVKDLDATFNHIYQALIHSGRLLVLTYPAESEYWSIFKDTLHKPQWHNLQQGSICPCWLTSDEYISLAKKTGFTILQAETIDEAAYYSDPQVFKDYVNGWLPCLVSASKEELDQFLEDVTLLAWARYQTKNICQIPYKKLHLYLEKIEK